MIIISTEIDNSIFGAYLKCAYKAYLKMQGISGEKADYELLQIRLSKEYRETARNFMISKWGNDKYLEDSLLTTYLKGNYGLGVDIRARFDKFEIVLDGIMENSKNKGNLVPIVFVHKERIAIADKLQTAFCGYILGASVKRMPSFGKIIYGPTHKTIRFKLDQLIGRVKPIVEDLKSLTSTKDPSSFYLNKHCQICEFYPRCLKTAKDKDHLSLITGLDAKRIKKLSDKGIFTVTQLSYTFKPRRKRKPTHRKLNPFRPELKALALRENKTYVFEIPELPETDIEIYFDVEGIPDRNFYYLAGLLINDRGRLKKLSFWADSEDEQVFIFRRLIEVLNKYEDYVIYHYGDYEKRYFKRMIKGLNGIEQKKTEKIVKKCCNILSYFYSNIYVPTYSNGLKVIAKFLGYSWAHKNASGIQSIMWRSEWGNTRSSEIKNTLIQYNMDDCFALKLVKEFVSSIQAKENDFENSDPEIVFPNQMKDCGPFKFLAGEYADPTIENIHKYSFFDYQRQRVFVRTDEFVRNTERRRVKKRKSILRPNKTISVSARVCTHCKSREISVGKQISRRIIDLKFSDAGIKRWITKFVSNVYHCSSCERSFYPEKYKLGTDRIIPKGCRKSRSKYGHNIKSWVIYQHIFNSQSFRQISNNLYEFFNLAIDKSTLHDFKNYIHKYYDSTYKALIKKIVDSDVVYVDETPIKMKNEDGYAWVFTNNKEIVSIYKSTREGEFLKDFLKDFDGILVSDFYTAYDSIDCIHQKCLIHLIRDMNDDLLKNPFNDELKFITQNFTALIQKIVKTIDRFGFKQKYLSKYKIDADRLFYRIAKKEFKSEVAIYYQDRFERNKNRLFEFINHDNVSWNNNNAERAIKLLATHTNRKIKMFSERRIRDFLKIMTIYQTCVYNNASFMKFLLSKERDFDKFFETYF